MHFEGTCKLETPRLILRRFEVKDAKYMFKNWASSKEVTKYLTWQAYSNEEDVKSYIENLVELYENPRVLSWCIELKEIGEPIGSISARIQSESFKIMEVGYCIGSKWWNKGITSEALKKVIKFLFNTVGVNRIEAYHDIRNVASGRVMQKCGMHFEGILREAEKTSNNEMCDVCLYSILKRDLKIIKEFCD